MKQGRLRISVDKIKVGGEKGEGNRRGALIKEVNKEAPVKMRLGRSRQ